MSRKRSLVERIGYMSDFDAYLSQLKLTARAREILRLMVEPKGDDDGQLVGESGQWWVDSEQTSWLCVRPLVQLCLIKLEYESGKFQMFVATEEARRILDDPKYVPEIVRALQAKKETAK